MQTGGAPVLWKNILRTFASVNMLAWVVFHKRSKFRRALVNLHICFSLRQGAYFHLHSSLSLSNTASKCIDLISALTESVVTYSSVLEWMKYLYDRDFLYFFAYHFKWFREYKTTTSIRKSNTEIKDGYLPKFRRDDLPFFFD